MDQVVQAVLALVIALAALLLIAIKTRLGAFIGLIVASLLVGLIMGMPLDKIASTVATGFGTTMTAIGIVIVLGGILSKLLEVTGGARAIAYAFLRAFGRERADVAMAATGYVVSIPVFCDSGFLILNPVAKALSGMTGVSILTIATALAVGLVATHHTVPPTPGPLAVASTVGLDLGVMIVSGLIFALPITVAGIVYARHLGKKIYQLPTVEGTWVRPKTKEEVEKITKGYSTNEMVGRLPPASIPLASIVIPILLIMVNTISGIIGEPTLKKIGPLIGHPIVALLVGVLIAAYGLTKYGPPNIKWAQVVNQGIESTALILVITAAGGSLGYVIRTSGAGDILANALSGAGLPLFLIPFTIASVVRLMQGSGTVAMITAASITAPMLGGLINPIILAHACTIGSMIASHFNDSYFWVVTSLSGLEDPKERVMQWTATTTIGWFVGLIELTIASLILR